jgi:hypothetical protein
MVFKISKADSAHQKIKVIDLGFLVVVVVVVCVCVSVSVHLVGLGFALQTDLGF